MDLEEAYTNASVWERFKPDWCRSARPIRRPSARRKRPRTSFMSACRTNFKAAAFEEAQHNKMLRELEKDIDAVTLDGKDVPVKLKCFDSLFVPLAKWSMLLPGITAASRRTNRSRSATPCTAT